MAAASSKWACLPLLLLVASFISLAFAARIFPLDTHDHSSISTSSPSDDLGWLPVTVSGVKRKLYVTPLQQYDNTAIISFPLPSPKWLDKKNEGIMSGEDVGTKTVVDELMDLEDVGMDDSNTGGASDDGKCYTLECGWNRVIAGARNAWGWNQGGGSRNGWESGGDGGDESDGDGDGDGGDESDGDGGASGSTGDSGDSTGGIGWSWGGGGEGGSGHIGSGGISIGGNGGSGRNRWHWGWHLGGGGSKVAAANDLNPKTGGSGMSSSDTDIANANANANAPAPTSN